MEFTLDLSSVIEPLERLRLSAPVAPSERQVNGWRVNVEPATTRDLEAALRMPDQILVQADAARTLYFAVDPVGAAARLE